MNFKGEKITAVQTSDILKGKPFPISIPFNKKILLRSLSQRLVFPLPFKSSLINKNANIYCRNLKYGMPTPKQCLLNMSSPINNLWFLAYTVLFWFYFKYILIISINNFALIECIILASPCFCLPGFEDCPSFFNELWNIPFLIIHI